MGVGVGYAVGDGVGGGVGVREGVGDAVISAAAITSEDSDVVSVDSPEFSLAPPSSIDPCRMGFEFSSAAPSPKETWPRPTNFTSLHVKAKIAAVATNGERRIRALSE